MKAYKTKRMKDEIMRLMRLTRPPRMEGVVKEAMMQPVRKPKAAREESPPVRKMQGHTEQQRKDYQLTSKRNR